MWRRGSAPGRGNSLHKDSEAGGPWCFSFIICKMMITVTPQGCWKNESQEAKSSAQRRISVKVGYYCCCYYYY